MILGKIVRDSVAYEQIESIVLPGIEADLLDVEIGGKLNNDRAIVAQIVEKERPRDCANRSMH